MQEESNHVLHLVWQTCIKVTRSLGCLHRYLATQSAHTKRLTQPLSPTPEIGLKGSGSKENCFSRKGNFWGGAEASVLFTQPPPQQKFITLLLAVAPTVCEVDNW